VRLLPISTGLLIAFSNTMLAYSLHTYQSKLNPTRIRARAVGFTYSWSRFSTIFVGFFIAFFLRNYGTTGVFLFIATAMRRLRIFGQRDKLKADRSKGA